MSNGTRDFEEDGFHEIQLSGKQLVFLCMATTVVSIVIFLCGVLVGRGVRPVEPVAEAASAPVAAEAPIVVDPPPAPAAAASAAPAPAPAPAAKGTAAAKAPAAATHAQTQPPPLKDAPAADELSYYDELSRKGGKKPGTNAKAEATKTAAAKPEAAKPEAAKPEPAKAAASAGSGPIAVQVGAFGTRGEAEKLAKRLSGKGYAAYIVSPEGGGPSVFKVRVGNYQSADEADRVKTRLTREEKLKPWVIR
jgi:hypothetical protein